MAEYFATITIKLKDHADHFAALHEALKVEEPISKIRAILDESKLEYKLDHGPSKVKPATTTPRKPRKDRGVPRQAPANGEASTTQEPGLAL